MRIGFASGRAPKPFHLRTGPFVTRVETAIEALREEIFRLYPGDAVSFPPDGFADFHVAVTPSWGVRWKYRPQIRFAVDGIAPFHPLPLDQALPTFEWGLNWAIASYANQYLILHAATIERDGRAVIMPGAPGSGKSTLTAALVSRGWRLLSDELTLLSVTRREVFGLARPISLKNESIEVIRRFAPEATMSPTVEGTAKGRVALVGASPESIARSHEPACPSRIIFPRYREFGQTVLTPRPKSVMLIRLARSAFNYSVFGAKGFTLLADIVDTCSCCDFTYKELDEAVEVFDRLDSLCPPGDM